MQNSKKNSEMTIPVLDKNYMQIFELCLDDAYFTLSRNLNSWSSKSEFLSSGTFGPWIWEHYVASKWRDQTTHSHSSISHKYRIIRWTSTKPHKLILHMLMLQKSPYSLKLWPSKVQWLQAKSQGQHFPKIQILAVTLNYSWHRHSRN